MVFAEVGQRLRSKGRQRVTVHHPGRCPGPWPEFGMHLESRSFVQAREENATGEAAKKGLVCLNASTVIDALAMYCAEDCADGDSGRGSRLRGLPLRQIRRGPC